MEWSPGWDLCAASFDVQSIRALSERSTPIATRGALSKSKSRRVLPMRAPRRERQARMTRRCRAWGRYSAVGRGGGRKKSGKRRVGGEGRTWGAAESLKKK